MACSSTRLTVHWQNRCSNAERAVPMIRPIRPGGSMRSARQLTQHCLPQGIGGELDWADLLDQPAGELVLVAAGELPESERGADLFTVVLDRPGRPRAAGERLGRHRRR
jgi:hypothetical protein